MEITSKKGCKIIKVVVFNGKTHMISEDIEPKEDGLFEATLVDHNNVRCEMWFRNGEIARLIELD